MYIFLSEIDNKNFLGIMVYDRKECIFRECVFREWKRIEVFNDIFYLEFYWKIIEWCGIKVKEIGMLVYVII